MRITNTLVFLILLLGGIVLLQIFLSKRENRLPGLVLPIIAFLFGLLYPLNMAAPSDGMTGGFVFQMLYVWLLGNIPTMILLAIYFGCRGKQWRNRQIDKRNIKI